LVDRVDWISFGTSTQFVTIQRRVSGTVHKQRVEVVDDAVDKS